MKKNPLKCRERERERIKKMKREGKSGEGEAEKEENLGEKLRRGALLVGKRGGPSTPVHSWRLWAPLPPSTLAAHDTIINNKDYFPFSHSLPSPSARKLAAALWEFQHYFPLSKMHRGVSNGGGGGADSRLRRHPHHHYKLSKDKGHDLSHFLADNSPSSPEQVLSLSLSLFFYLLGLRFFFFFFFMWVFIVFHVSISGYVQFWLVMLVVLKILKSLPFIVFIFTF